MDGVTVRPARTEDAPAMAGIEAGYIVSGVENWRHEPPTPAEFAARLAKLSASGYPALVAIASPASADESAGRLLGYAYAGPFHEQAGWRHTVEHSIYVDPHAQRLGIGRRLLTELIATCAAAGFRQMIAGISDPGAETSIAFHAAMGFSHVGRFADVGWKHGGWLSVVYMQRPLGAGATTPASL
ncbi:MAG: GNAT family N-acetyltransferase [Hyphomicrobiaceae bacterium]|nr:GNAT family N-acetyltransferase [Hyphomicrobiaceae bacterium]